MEQKQSVVNLTVNCVSGGNNTSNNNDDKPAVKHKRRFRGHGWSHTKRKSKKKTQKFLCYAVFRPKCDNNGIFYNWAECEKKVKHYSNPVFKGFHSDITARDWLRGEQTKETVYRMLEQQKEAKTETPSAHATVISTASAMPSHVDNTVTPIPFATAVPVETPTAVPAHAPTKKRRERDFSPVAEMARLISNCSPDDMPQPPVCTCATCPYMSGEIMHIRKALLQRLYQTGLITAQHKD